MVRCIRSLNSEHGTYKTYKVCAIQGKVYTSFLSPSTGYVIVVVENSIRLRTNNQQFKTHFIEVDEFRENQINVLINEGE